MIEASGRLSGSWSEMAQSIRGSLSGFVANGRITGSFTGPGFNAQASVVTRGNNQTVDIQTASSEIRAVSVNLRKSTR
jgi:hypothetical protein